MAEDNKSREELENQKKITEERRKQKADAKELLKSHKDANEVIEEHLTSLKSISSYMDADVKTIAKSALQYQKLSLGVKNILSMNVQMTKTDNGRIRNLSLYHQGLISLENLRNKISTLDEKDTIHGQKIRQTLDEQYSLVDDITSEHLQAAKALKATQDEMKGITSLSQQIEEITNKTSVAIENLSKERKRDLNTANKIRRELESQLEITVHGSKEHESITKQIENQQKIIQDIKSGYRDVTKYLKENESLLIDTATQTDDINKKNERLKYINESNKTLYEAMPESLRSAVDFGKKLTTTMKTAGAGAVAWTLLAGVLVAAISSFVNLQEAAKDFRTETGLTVSQTRELDTQANSVVMRFAGIGVEAKDVYSTVSALKSEFADFVDFSEESVSALVLMNKNFGVSFDSASKVQGIFENIGGLSTDTAASVQMQVVQMANMAKVAPSKVMADIAENAEISSTLFKGDVVALSRSAIEARRLGTNLKSVASVAEKLLDFEGGIEEELVAATFVSGQFNLSRARALAFEGKIVEAQRETLAQIQRSGDFRQKDYFTQQQLAKAAGMSVEEITKQLGIQDKLSNLTTKEREEVERALDVGLDITNVNKEQIKQELEKFKLQREQQGELENIKNQFMGIVTTVGSILVPLLKMITPILELIADSVGLLVSGFTRIGDFFSGTKTDLGELNAGFGTWVGAIFLGGTGLIYMLNQLQKMKTFLGSINILQKAGLAIQKLKTLFTRQETNERVRQETLQNSSSVTGQIRNNIPDGGEGKPGKGIFNSISKINTKDMLRGAASILILSGAIFVAAKAFKEFEGVEWEQVGMGITSIIGLSVAARILGAGAPLTIKGALAVAVLGAALIPFGYALNLVAPFVSAFGEVITSVGGVIASILGGIPPILKATVKGIQGLLGSITPQGVASLWALGPALISASVGIGTFAISVTALSLASKLGGNVIDSLSGLGSLTEKLPLINEQLTGMGGILSQLGEYVGPVDMLTTSLNNLASSLVSIGTLSAIGSIFSKIIGPDIIQKETGVEQLADITVKKKISSYEPTQMESVISTPLNVLINEVKMLRQDMANGKIAVYMDTEKVTSKIARQVDVSTKNNFNLTRT